MANVDVRSSCDAIGILFRKDQLVGCRAVKTMFGGVKYQYATATVVAEDLNASLAELLQSLGAGKDPLPILAALSTEDCYFATRPIASGAASASPRVLLRESLRSSAARLDQMTIDVIYWQPDRRNVAGIAAAPKEQVESIREAVAANGHSLQRLEPAASCLIAVAHECEGRDRRSTLTTRVLLGEESLLAVMSRGGQPIHWQRLPLPAGDEATGIVSAVRALETAAAACGLDHTPETVVIHGRRELSSLIDAQWLSDKLIGPDNASGDVRWIDSPTLQGTDVARSLADRFLSGQDEGLDFVRQHRDPLQLRRVVPYKEVIAYSVAASVLAFVLWMRVAEIKDRRIAIVSTAPAMIAGGTEPKPERDQLNARATAVSQFLDKRVLWSSLISEITQAIPDGMRLTEIRGAAPMDQRRKKQVKTAPVTLVLRGECALADDGSVPPTLDKLADSMREIDSVQKHFTHVELGDVRRTSSVETGIEGAEFSLVFTSGK